MIAFLTGCGNDNFSIGGEDWSKIFADDNKTAEDASKKD